MLEDHLFAERAALALYGDLLVKRMHGEHVTTVALALWRMFAWEQTGRRKKGFVLRASDILQAENDVVSTLAAKSS